MNLTTEKIGALVVQSVSTKGISDIQTFNTEASGNISVSNRSRKHASTSTSAHSHSANGKQPNRLLISFFKSLICSLKSWRLHIWNSKANRLCSFILKEVKKIDKILFYYLTQKNILDITKEWLMLIHFLTISLVSSYWKSTINMHSNMYR